MYIYVYKKKKFSRKPFYFLPEDATIGPQARANAPSERNVPVITPF